MSKKQLIMDSALDLFAKQGFEATSVQQITDYCGISKGAFYLSFKSKDELIIALIDHFMEAFISDIDYIVKTTNNEELLYSFYYTNLQSFHKHSDFGKIFIKEQTHSLNQDLLGRIRYYNALMDSTILLMVERLYGEEITHIKYDLMYCIKSFVTMYSELFLFNNVVSLDLDLDLLAHSLVEKTNLLAKHTSIPFLTKEIIQVVSQTTDDKVKREQLLELLEQNIKEMDEPIIKESLILLKQQLLNPNLSPAIVAGLLENIQKNPHCKWVSYLLRHYFQI
ncbi:TetR/AcrR family transcriptional regulator [Oceanobacillus sp. Castelsardo]|uniref:TetR/AcrR family transcriptional regulator n=1 Tax=Oceanobacillus sp. Castelsardo TaxID=1851204 RepID=UPI00083904C5|nr:TetR/AcrR family transcriptional regulator [Oceanobacillus sp. Castelsardo]